LDDNQAVSFFIKLEEFRNDVSVQSLTLENSQTQEKLVIKGRTQGHEYVSISRYPMGTNEEEWAEEMQMSQRQYPSIVNRRIEFITLDD
jgi:hypothetical protein